MKWGNYQLVGNFFVNAACYTGIVVKSVLLESDIVVFFVEIGHTYPER
ncbi:Hypothetical protein DPCES_2742 [Desulfitobacterium hafniense]|uniref:Uncharacterized protein n=1 Tax=Desulfitobacterium hafniense TaxID=49338 RepID=A0A098B175_DESHA|nr:Hypothetical protein DPCES_2742 [Desulfitobacterium hafniense]